LIKPNSLFRRCYDKAKFSDEIVSCADAIGSLLDSIVRRFQKARSKYPNPILRQPSTLYFYMTQQFVSGWLSPKLTRIKYQRKLISFVITTATAFSLSLFCWSWTIKEYQTNAEIPIRLSGEEGVKQDFQTLLANAIRAKIIDSKLDEVLQLTKDQAPIESQILSGDLESIRKALLVQVLSGEEPEQIKVQLTLLGRGSRDEQVFLGNFASELSQSLDQLSSLVSDRTFQVENAQWIKDRNAIERLEQSLAFLEKRIDGACQLCQSSSPSPQPGPFRTASHSQRTTVPKMTEVHQALAEIDLTCLHQTLADLKASMESRLNSNFYASEVRSSSVGCPQPKQLWILFIIASASGIFVANHFQPFAETGFGSLGAVSKLLRVPVIATLPNNVTHQADAGRPAADGRKLPWANRCTHGATIVLLTWSVFIIGFCCMDQEIRGSLFRNPVDGIARILWYFKGR
jgi:hypothetical protein